MKKSKKIIIAVVSALLVVVIALVSVAAIIMHRIPALDENVKRANIFERHQTYILAKAPYTSGGVFETQMGMFSYWKENRAFGKGIDVVLQLTKDNEIIVLSDELPGKSNAEILFDKGTKVSDLTLEELKTINLAYNFEDEDGIKSYMAYDEKQLDMVNVLSLRDFFSFFGNPIRSGALLYVRFKDEATVPDYKAAVDKVYEEAQRVLLLDRLMFRTENDETAKYVEEACPEMMRSATPSEVKALYRACLSNKAPGEFSFDSVIVKAGSRFATEKFVHYMRNTGIPIVIDDAKQKDILQYRSWGVTAVGTSEVSVVGEILKEATLAEKEAKKANN